MKPVVVCFLLLVLPLLGPYILHETLFPNSSFTYPD